MKTWRELLGGGPNRTPDIDSGDDDGDNGFGCQAFVTVVATRQESEPQNQQPFVANVADTVESHPDAGIYAEIDLEHGKSWDTWVAEQRTRIFDEGRATGVFVPKEADTAVSTFQRSFFAELAEISADSEKELLETAGRRGIPAECSHAFWRAKQRLKKGPAT